MFQEFSLFSLSPSKLQYPPTKKKKDTLLEFGKIDWENLTEKRNSDRSLTLCVCIYVCVCVCVCKTIYKTSKELNLV